VVQPAISTTRSGGRFSFAGNDPCEKGNTSSTTQRVDIRMASKIGNSAVSFQGSPIRTSPASLNDFTCTSGTCRWGDYSAATPDPATPLSASRGQVWLTNGFVRTTGTSGSGWGTRNWAATP
jgi:hypothetical protein